MANQTKKSQVDALISALEKNNNFLLIKIDKTTHQNLETLRRELRATGATIKVLKNTFFEKAVNKMSSTNKSFSQLKKTFFPVREPSAMVLLDRSWDKGLKAFYQFIQKEKTLSFKLSLLDNQFYNDSQTEAIAKLPAKEELLAKIIGSMKSPMSKLVYSLKYNTNKFVYILQAKSKEVKS